MLLRRESAPEPGARVGAGGRVAARDATALEHDGRLPFLDPGQHEFAPGVPLALVGGLLRREAAVPAQAREKGADQGGRQHAGEVARLVVQDAAERAPEQRAVIIIAWNGIRM